MKNRILEELDRFLDEKKELSAPRHELEDPYERDIASRLETYREPNIIQRSVQNLISFTLGLSRNIIILALIILVLFCIHIAVKINGGYEKTAGAYKDFKIVIKKFRK